MSIDLPQDLTSQLQAQMIAGRYSSEEQVLRDALMALVQRQTAQAKLQAMIREAEADVAAGRLAPLDRDALKTEIRAALGATGVAE